MSFESLFSNNDELPCIPAEGELRRIFTGDKFMVTKAVICVSCIIGLFICVLYLIRELFGKKCRICHGTSFRYYQCAIVTNSHYCLSCFKDHLWMKLRENAGTARPDPPCLNHCGATLTLSRIQAVLSRKDYHAFCEESTRTHLAQHAREMVWCRCGNGCWTDCSTETSFHCQECKRWTCAGPKGCGYSCGGKKSRKTFRKHQCISTKIPDTTPCGKCGILLQRASGCSSIRCTRCNTTTEIKSIAF